MRNATCVFSVQVRHGNPEQKLKYLPKVLCFPRFAYTIMLTITISSIMMDYIRSFLPSL